LEGLYFLDVFSILASYFQGFGEKYYAKQVDQYTALSMADPERYKNKIKNMRYIILNTLEKKISSFRFKLFKYSNVNSLYQYIVVWA
jgi:hypothetical protein